MPYAAKISVQHKHTDLSKGDRKRKNTEFSRGLARCLLYIATCEIFYYLKNLLLQLEFFLSIVEEENPDFTRISPIIKTLPYAQKFFLYS